MTLCSNIGFRSATRWATVEVWEQIDTASWNRTSSCANPETPARVQPTNRQGPSFSFLDSASSFATRQWMARHEWRGSTGGRHFLKLLDPKETSV
jgi:hypothetical protein